MKVESRRRRGGKSISTAPVSPQCKIVTEYAISKKLQILRLTEWTYNRQNFDGQIYIHLKVKFQRQFFIIKKYLFLLFLYEYGYLNQGQLQTVKKY